MCLTDGTPEGDLKEHGGKYVALSTLAVIGTAQDPPHKHRCRQRLPAGPRQTGDPGSWTAQSPAFGLLCMFRIHQAAGSTLPLWHEACRYCRGAGMCKRLVGLSSQLHAGLESLSHAILVASLSWACLGDSRVS